jgi:two-component system sensor histidine kinase/response regulator
MTRTDGRPSILVVDDVEANLVAMEAQLGNLDCDIVRVNSGNNALRQLLKREFAVILLDVQMPDMDGFEVARLARENPSTRDIPIIFVTAMHETEGSVLRGYGSGAVDFLFKPINPHILLSKVKIFLDLYTNRRRLSEEVEAHKRTLSELEAFNYSVSHDLRAPLRPLAGFSQALLEDFGSQLDERALDYLKRIRAAAQRMGNLIDDLLQLSRISRSDIKRQPVDLSDVASAVLTDIRTSDPDRKIETVVQPEMRVVGDARLLRIVLDNLLRNAWKFTGKRPNPRIEVGAKAEKPPVYFVRDNGAGFDPAFASRLFQPFQRLHSLAEFEGTGIGLAIVTRIIERHGGRVWAQAAVDQGATFYFTLTPSGGPQ